MEDEREDQKLIGYSGKTIDDSVVENEKRAKKKKWIIIGLIVAAVAILIIVLAVTLSKKDHGPEPTPPGPEPGPTPVNPSPQNPYSAPANFTTTPGSVSGFIYAKEFVASSKVLSSAKQLLAQVKTPSDLTIDPHSIPQGDNNRLIQNISFAFGMTDYRVGHLVMRDANNARYEVPDEVISQASLNPTMRLEMLGFSLAKDSFAFSFTDLRDKNNVYISTANSSLVMMDKYIQMEFQLPSQRTYGFGERVKEFTLGEGAWTMWAKGQDSPYDDGMGGKGVYGVHPFILIQSKNPGDFFGMFFKNSNAQSPLLKHKADGTSTLYYITTGGILDIYFFTHGSAKDIIKSYHNVIGKPTLPPFWALGWHQASWKYENQSMIEEVVNNYTANDMPLETIWLDIPYMDGYADFTVNKTAFPSMSDYYNKVLKPKNQKLVLILDAALAAVDPTSKYVVQATADKALIMSNLTGEPLKMKVWPTKAVFMDWFNTKVLNTWGQGLKDLYDLLPYDGIWIDMNEATGFEQGENTTKPTPPPPSEEKARLEAASIIKRFLQETVSDQAAENWYDSVKNQSQNSTYDLPFIPGYWEDLGNNNKIFRRFDNMSISLNATHNSTGLREYDVHSLYGAMMAKRTYEVLTDSSPDYQSLYPNTDRRPFILSRSTFASSGKHTSHWLGDNWRKWEYLRYSIAGIMNMNMFGIPLAGADVCGFFGLLRDDQMCARWLQLSTFYPFARAHQNITWEDGQYGESNRSEPYYLEGVYKEMARESLYDRYTFSRALYTCLYEVQLMGGTCFDPLFYYYPTDENLYNNIEDTFMVAGAFKVSPVLDALPDGKNATFMSYFPQGKWVSLRDFSVLDASAGGKQFELNATTLTVQVHLKEGSIVAIQNNSDHHINNSQVALTTPIQLVVNPDPAGFATGSLYIDKDGDSRSDLNTGKYSYYKLVHSAKSLKFYLDQGNNGVIQTNNSQISNITIANLAVNSSDFACALGYDGIMNVTNLTIQYLNTSIFISNGTSTIDISKVRQIYYGKSGVDLNLCDTESYKYTINATEGINLDSNNVTFRLSHRRNILPDLKVQVQLLGEDNIINFNITLFNPSDSTRQHSPVDIGSPKPALSTNQNLSRYVNVSLPGEDFGLNVFTAVLNESIYNVSNLVFDDYFLVLQQTVSVAAGIDQSTTGVWGLGERISNFFYQDGVYTSLARDDGSPVDYGKPPGHGMYGHHPVFYGKSSNASYYGVLNLNPGAADFYIKNSANFTNVTHVTIGGIFDVYIMVTATPEDVIKQYHSIVGKPLLIPQWGLGWHQCRWGYTNTSTLENVVQNYNNSGIPLEVLWSDIDYLETYRDFTYDPVNFNGLPALIDTLHNKSMYYVPILDAGVARRPWGNYSAYTAGSAAGAFITIGDNKTELIGQVWPNDAVYPDFYSKAGQSFWMDQLTGWHDQMKFDGIWEDMNEASDFCDGECYNQLQNVTEYGKLRYVPGDRFFPQHGISLDGQHANGQKEVDLHNLFGFSEVRTTAEWYTTKQNQRPFIISRSTHAGQGKYGSHWLGDNSATNEDMGRQVTGIMLMNMFGIPVSGADICGFGGNTNAELCARWTVVGSFSPFSRNHNAWDSIDQEPYVWTGRYEEGITYTDIMRNAIRNRYNLVRYYYTQLYMVNQNGGTFYKPLFHEYPSDQRAYQNLTYNIMLGSALKLSVLTDMTGQNATTFYYPNDTYCNVFNNTDCFVAPAEGMTLTQQTKAYDFYLYQRAGYVVPLQNASLTMVNTTAQLQNMSVNISVHPKQGVNNSWSATGFYYNDDGKNLTTVGNGNLYFFNATGNSSELNFNVSISLQAAATNYNVSNCTAVNRNDYLEGFQFLNAQNLSMTGANYTLWGSFVNGTNLTIGFASYEAANSRVATNLTSPVCLSLLTLVEFIPTVVPTPPTPPSE